VSNNVIFGTQFIRTYISPKFETLYVKRVQYEVSLSVFHLKSLQ